MSYCFFRIWISQSIMLRKAICTYWLFYVFGSLLCIFGHLSTCSLKKLLKKILNVLHLCQFDLKSFNLDNIVLNLGQFWPEITDMDAGYFTWHHRHCCEQFYLFFTKTLKKIYIFIYFFSFRFLFFMDPHRPRQKR